MGNNPWSRVDPYGEYGANPWHNAYLEYDHEHRAPQRAKAARERRELVESGNAGPMLEIEDSIANSLTNIATLGFVGESNLDQAARFDQGGYLYEVVVVAEVAGFVGGASKTVLGVGGKIVQWGRKGVVYVFRKSADDIAGNVVAKAGSVAPSPGVTVKKVGNYWIKEVDKNSNRLLRWHGERSLRYQSAALTKLGDMAPRHILKNGKLVSKDAGRYTPGSFWKTWFEGSRRLGTPINDIRPRNIGANGIIFDPALDPLARILYWTAGTGVVGATGYVSYEAMVGTQE